MAKQPGPARGRRWRSTGSRLDSGSDGEVTGPMAKQPARADGEVAGPMANLKQLESAGLMANLKQPAQ